MVSITSAKPVTRIPGLSGVICLIAIATGVPFISWERFYRRITLPPASARPSASAFKGGELARQHDQPDTAIRAALIQVLQVGDQQVPVARQLVAGGLGGAVLLEPDDQR